MNIKINPAQSEWSEILARPVYDLKQLRAKVQSILNDVATNGDDAIRKYTLQFDGISLDRFEVTAREIESATTLISSELKTAIGIAASNIRKFHEAQVAPFEKISIAPGIDCWQKSVGIERVGLYIPGGSAPLFSTVLMLAIPAAIAGCREIVLCTPPSKDGTIHPAIIYAAQLTGVSKIYKIGGVQAIAAMAYGTQSIKPVYKIFGPGNQYVNCAKQLVQLDGVAIDLPAGPSEVCVIADESADPEFVASDLISQAEHGEDSQVLMITTNESICQSVLSAIDSQLKILPRAGIARTALSKSFAVIMDSMNEVIEMANRYASEHLIVCCKDADHVANQIINAGSVFIGNYSPEAAGDYATGTNHTLPTNGFARAFSGVSVDSFSKKVTFQQLSREGLISIAPAIIEMAQAEGLEGHAGAVKIRIKK